MEQEEVVLDTEGPMATTKDIAVRKPCPECGKLFKPSGLAGHLRFVHSYTGKKASVATREAPGDSVSKVDKIFQIIERIEKVRDRMQFVQDHRKDKGSIFRDDDASDEAMEALTEEERRLTDELRLLQGKKKVKGFFGDERWEKAKEQEN